VTESGRNWQRLGIPDPAAVSSLTFLDARRGWMGTMLLGADLQRPFLLKTTAAGGGWQRQELTAPGSLGGSQAVMEAPRFFGANRGVAVLRGARSFAYTTEDGGKSWSGPIDLPFNGSLTSSDGTHWFQVASGRSEGETASSTGLAGGWVRRPLAVPSGWNALLAVSTGPRDVWVVLWGAGPAFGLLHSTDGGAGWKEVGLPRSWGGPVQPTAVRTESTGAVRETVALLGNNHLVLIPAGGAAPRWEVVLAPAPDTSATHGYLGTGHRLAWSADRSTLYALPAVDYFGSAQMAVVDVAAGHVRRTVPLPQGIRVGSLAVGPGDRVYLVGQQNKTIVIAVYDPGEGRITRTWQGRNMSHWQPRGPVGGDFTIYQAQLTHDGRRLYYSYLGGLLPQAGVDWVELDADRISLCTPPEPASACMPGLAGFRLLGDQVLLTSANDAQDGLVGRYQPDGSRLDGYHLKLGSGLVNDIALDETGRRIYAVGSCGYTAGMSVVALGTGQATVLVPPSVGQHGPDAVCGQRLELIGTEQLVVGRVAALSASPASRGTLLFIDTRKGSVLHRVEVSAEPVDVAVR
jgi:hypothetical protein